MLRQLTKTRPDGTVYRRRPQTDQLLLQLLTLDRPQLRERLAVRDRGDPRYIPTECLIYLLREADQDARRGWFDALFLLIRNRCKQTLTRAIRASGRSDDETLREEALSRFELYLARGLRADPEKLDVLEVAFDLALASMRKDLFAEETRRNVRFTELRIATDEDADDQPQMEFVQPVSELAAELDMQESEFEVFRTESLRSINVLPDDERDAILYLLGGVQIGSKDRNVDTIAKRQNVDERTVRNRIQRGIRRLNGTQGNDQ